MKIENFYDSIQYWIQIIIIIIIIIINNKWVIINNINK
jgi:hypothetical protein